MGSNRFYQTIPEFKSSISNCTRFNYSMSINGQSDSGSAAIKFDDKSREISVFSKNIHDAGEYQIMIIGVEFIAGNSANSSFILTIISTNSGPPYFTDEVIPNITLIVPDSYVYVFP